MSPNTWGQPTWCFLHTFAEKIKEEKYLELKDEIYGWIKELCSNLPCPDCTQHATKYMSTVIKERLATKKDLQILLFMFHNYVNQRKKTQLFKYEDLQKTYEGKNIVQTYNNFATNFHTRGNMNLIAESFRRKQFLERFRTWMIKYHSIFN
jgi:Erv1 / Alr family